MNLGSADFSGRATFITGPGRACGKTTLLKRALAMLRDSGEAPAFMGMGFDGEGPKADSGGWGGAASRTALSAAPRISARAGELFVSSEAYLRGSPCSPEILAALPGHGALGRLAIARARRDGDVVLVGPERNEYAALAIETIMTEGWARSVLVDGAINRITQVSAFSGARFIFVSRVSPGDLGRQLRSIRRMYGLARLPTLPPPAGADRDSSDERWLEDSARKAGLPLPVCLIKGPLTADTLALAPRAGKTIVVEDLTKVFLDEAAFASLTASRSLATLAGIEFGGFVVVLRDMSRRRFLEALGEPEIGEMIAFNPYETMGSDD